MSVAKIDESEEEAIEVEVMPVRSEPYASKETGEVLIGAHITKICTRERIIFTDFLHDCEAA